jgi:hypothetical protein
MKNVFRLEGHVPYGHVYRTGRGGGIVNKSLSFVSAPEFGFITSYIRTFNLLSS